MEERSAVWVGVVLLIMFRTAVVRVFPSPAESSGEPNVSLSQTSTGSQSDRADIEASAESEAEVGETAGVETDTAGHGANIEGSVSPDSSGLNMREVSVGGSSGVVLGEVLRAAVREIVLAVARIRVESNSVFSNPTGDPEANRSNLKSQAESQMSSLV